jgi:hypothetical protein
MKMESNPVEDARQIQLILSGKEKDDDKLIKLVTSRTNEERLKIKDEYNSTFNSDLINDLKKAYSFHFEDVLVGLFYSPVDYDCYHIRKAVKGLGTNENTLIEILSTRDKEHIEKMKLRYKELYPGRDMVQDIKKDTSGSFWKVLSTLLESNRDDDENKVLDKEKCKEDAKNLYQAAQTKTNHVEIFTDIFTKRTKYELIEIGRIYHQISKNSILQEIQNLFSGDTKNALEGIIYGILSPSEYFAKILYKSMKGLGTSDTTLIRVMISRNEIDMPQIKQYYRNLYNKDLVSAIKGDTSGNYQKILVELATH